MGAMFGRNNMTPDCEAQYLTLYRDMQEHQSFWFEEFFSSDDNHEYAQQSCSILGTLASIQRIRKDLQAAHTTIQLYTKVANMYLAMCERSHDQDQKYSCEVVTYKHDLVCSNNYQELQMKSKCLPHFRRAVEYELRHNLSVQEQNLAFVVPQFLGINNPKYYPLTIPKFRDVPDSKIWKCLMTSLGVAAGDIDTDDALLKIKRCLGCQKMEPIKNQFMNCAACKTALYCSVKCQRKHWKVHKQECSGRSKKTPSANKKETASPKKEAPKISGNKNNAHGNEENVSPHADEGGNNSSSKAQESETTSISEKKKVNVPDTDLRDVAKMLAQNFATTVLQHTNHVISRENVEGCQPRLVKLFKELLTTTCPRLNSVLGFTDGCRDAIFLEELDQFFVKQPGFEKYQHILTSNKALFADHRQQLCSPDNLRVAPEDLEERSKTVLNGIAKNILRADPDVYVTKAVRKNAVNGYAAFMREFMLSHPDYNSYQGMYSLSIDNPDNFQEKSIALIGKLFEFPTDEEE
eukprot:scaffold62468_cov45-Attheya_sp.AAC.6